jgi:hypothetical protein
MLTRDWLTVSGITGRRFDRAVSQVTIRSRPITSSVRQATAFPTPGGSSAMSWPPCRSPQSAAPAARSHKAIRALSPNSASK